MTTLRPFDPARAILAVIVGETLPVLTLVAIVAVAAPADPNEASELARRVGTWVGPAVGVVSAFLLSTWAGLRCARSVAQGAAIGLALALIDAMALAAMGESFAPTLLASNVGKVVAGTGGGWTAARIRGGRSSPDPSGG